MRIQTFSIVAGSEACNARCPFCISKMTVPHGLELDEPEVNWRNFHKACALARASGVTTAMLTGKGEPTLFPNQITRFLHEMQDFAFPMIELQTNGIQLIARREAYGRHLREWHHLGMTMVAVSIVHWQPEPNRSVYLPHREAYIDLPALIDQLHTHGLSVRLACVMADGFVDSEQSLLGLVDFAKANGVEQLTVRPVSHPDESRDEATDEWTRRHALPAAKRAAIAAYLDRAGDRLMSLMHGAVVYDLNGQNVCLTGCLTIDPAGDDVRQLIFFPDGHLRYDWQYAGAILL